MRIRLHFSALVAAVALTVAACGGEGTDRNEYVNSINRAVATLQSSMSSLGDVGSASSGKQIAARLQDGGEAMDAAAADFDKIAPPSDAERAHAKLVDGLHKFADTFHDAAKAARANDGDKLQATLANIERSPGAREIQQAQDDLEASGYKVDQPRQ